MCEAWALVRRGNTVFMQEMQDESQEPVRTVAFCAPQYLVSRGQCRVMCGGGDMDVGADVDF